MHQNSNLLMTHYTAAQTIHCHNSFLCDPQITAWFSKSVFPVIDTFLGAHFCETQKADAIISYV